MDIIVKVMCVMRKKLTKGRVSGRCAKTHRQKEQDSDKRESIKNCDNTCRQNNAESIKISIKGRVSRVHDGKSIKLPPKSGE